jgi:GT2 family glycosyltransferase
MRLYWKPRASPVTDMNTNNSWSAAGPRPAATSDQPLVSVVMPVFNGERFIAEAIDSALNQEYPHVEVIVIDDGSSDRTVEIVRGYDDRVRLLMQENKGSAAARNMGVRDAKGHYVAFLDADDVWHPAKLREQVGAMQRGGYKMAYSQFKVWNPQPGGGFVPAERMFSEDNPALLGDIRLVTGWTYADLLLDCFVWTSTVIVERAELLKAGLFDEILRKGQDYDLWLRLSRNIQMIGLEQPTALYRHHGGNITHSVKHVNYEYLILSTALRKWGEAGPDKRTPPPGLVQSRLARSMLSHAYSHFHHGSARVAAESFRRAMTHTGPKLKPMVLYYLSMLKAQLQRVPQG